CVNQLAAVAALTGGGACGDEFGALLDRAVSIGGAALDGGVRLVVHDACGVRVLAEVAVGTVHALLKMYVLEMDGLTRFAEDGRRGRIVIRVGYGAAQFFGGHVLDGPAEG